MDTKVMTILANRVNKNIAYLYVITYHKGSKHTLLVLLSHGYGGGEQNHTKGHITCQKE